MRRVTLALFLSAFAFAELNSMGQSLNSWISTSSGTWSTAGNWSLGQAPSTSTGPGISVADYPGTATLQKAIDLAGATGRVSYGAQFDFTAGGTGYTFSGTAGTVSGMFLRSGGTINGGVGGIVNNDDNTQTFNVPIKLTTSTGVAGPGSAMTFNAAAGNLVFNGNNNAPATPWTINLNGATALTFDGAFNITIGSSGPGQIVNTNSPSNPNTGLIKNGAGTLTLGGTAANTFTGVNKLNAGLTLAAKVNALGSGNALVMSGGTFNTGGLNQSLGTLDLDGTASLDLGAGASAVSFANSSAIDWSTFNLNISNWTEGVDTLRFGTDGTGLTAQQLNQIFFSDFNNATAQIDSSGFITPTPTPEPQTVAMIALGLTGLIWVQRSRQRA